MAGLLRYLIIAAVVFAVWWVVRMVVRTMQQGSQRGPEITMPYCQKCESNRNVVVNAGHVDDHQLRWYCTRCREGF